MKLSELKWSKTKAQCPYCEGWYTKQGILGHIRFRHPNKDDLLRKEQLELKKLIYNKLYFKAAEERQKNGRLPVELRESILDLMLMDFLSKKAENHD